MNLDAAISIHAPLAGSDLEYFESYQEAFISIHAPLAGSDQSKPDSIPKAFIFQSTLPLRGATLICPSSISLYIYFNPRSPCGERRCYAPRKLGSRHFNPRSPCGERHWRLYRGDYDVVFQSTLPLRGATLCRSCADIHITISIHAPLAGSDQWHFLTGNRWPLFQSTLPLRGATNAIITAGTYGRISIHAPLAGSDGWGS